MSQQIQELIDKIKSEGVETAQEKAREIEHEARQKADTIVQLAQKESDKIIQQAQDEAKKLETKTHTALQQASRDMILALKKEIQDTLSKIVSAQVSQSLSPENLSDILKTLIEGFFEKQSQVGDVTVFLSDSDLKKLKDGSVGKLQEKLKSQAIELQTSRDVNKGFSISFDKGKSNFDFSDQSLAEYLSSYLNPEIASLLKEATVK